jgi:hypothetical protein
MKKTIILAALLVASTIASADMLVGSNNAGGRIVLQEKTCVGPNGKVYENLRSMFTTSPTGDIIRGCWRADEETQTALVIYYTGDIRYYDPSTFRLVKTPDPKAMR